MRKVILLGTILALMAALAMTSCASKPESSSTVEMSTDYPDFFLNPPVLEDQYVGLGMAKLTDANLARTTAVARARADIAFQVSTSVQAMLTDYAQESGADGNSQTLSFIESVTKQVADIELQGAKTDKVYPAKDGTWYVMVLFPKAALIDTVGEVFARNEDAAFAEFKAQQALDRLNAEVADNPTRSAGLQSPVNQ
jgi:hypothetical protein